MAVGVGISLLLIVLLACSRQDDAVRQAQPAALQQGTRASQLPDLPEVGTRNIFALVVKDDSGDVQLYNQWHKGWKLVGTFSTHNQNWQAIVQTPKGRFVTTSASHSLPDSDMRITAIDKNSMTIKNSREESIVVTLEQ